MSNPLATLEFNQHSVRIIPTEDNLSFYVVAKDATEVLGYRSANDGLRSVPDNHKGTRSVRTLGGDQQMLCIDEAGLYRLILRSNKSEAEPFMEWVTSEVLPSIRKTGGYAVAEVESPLFQQKYYAQLEENGTLKSKIIDLLEQASVKEQQLLAKNKRPTTNKMSLDEKKDIIRLHLAGHMIPAICKEVGRGRTSVRKTIRAFKDTGDIS